MHAACKDVSFQEQSDDATHTNTNIACHVELNPVEILCAVVGGNDVPIALLSVDETPKRQG